VWWCSTPRAVLRKSGAVKPAPDLGMSSTRFAQPPQSILHVDDPKPHLISMSAGNCHGAALTRDAASSAGCAAFALRAPGHLH